MVSMVLVDENGWQITRLQGLFCNINLIRWYLTLQAVITSYWYVYNYSCLYIPILAMYHIYVNSTPLDLIFEEFKPWNICKVDTVVSNEEYLMAKPGLIATITLASSKIFLVLSNF